MSLVSAIPWFCAIVFTAIWPVLAGRANRPRLFFLICLLMVASGILVSAHSSPLVAIVALCVAASGIIASQAIFWTFPTDHFGGTAAAGGLAVINSIGNLGGFVAPNLRAAADHAFGPSTAGLHALSIPALVLAAAAMLLPARGRRVVAATLKGFSGARAPERPTGV